MTSIVSSIKTDEKGEALIDLSEIETGDYSVSASFSQTNQYSSQTATKEYHVFNGYYTRVKINNNVISNSTIISAAYNDDTLLTFKLEYSEDETNWSNKSNWTIIVTANGQTFTVTSANPTLNLSLLNVADHTININYPGDTNYYPCTYNITYKQSKNTPTLTASNVEYYVDESKEATVKLSTSGKGVPDILVSMTKQGNTYTSTTNNEGIATFSASVSNDPLATNTDTTTYTLEDDTENIGTITTNDEYVLQIQNDNGYTITIDRVVGITFNGNQLVIEDPNITFYKPYSPEDSDKIRITYHNNVFRVIINDNLIYSHYYTSLSEDIIVQGDCTITLIQQNALTTGTTVNTATVTYSFNGDDNLNSATSTTATFTHKELGTTNNLTYQIDGHHNDKVPNYWSKYTWTHNLEYGYYANGVNHDLVSTYQPYVGAGSYVNFIIYNRELHGCMFYEEVYRLVYPLDWFVTDNNTYSGLNINLEPSATSLGHINTLTLTANIGVSGKNIKLYNNNTLVTNGNTGADGKKVFTITQPSVGNYNYRAYFSGDTSFDEAQSDIIPVLVYDSTTTLTLASDKSTYTYPEPVVLTADLGISGKTIKVGNNTATTDSEGVATFTLTNVLPNNYTYTAQFLGDANYNSCTSNNVQILINKLTTTTNITASPEYIFIGDTLTITGTTTNVANGTGLTIKPFGVRTNVYNNSYTIDISRSQYSSTGIYNIYAETDESSTNKPSSSSYKRVKVLPQDNKVTGRYRSGGTIYKGQYLYFDFLDSVGDLIREGSVHISVLYNGTILDYVQNIDSEGFAKLQINLNYSGTLPYAANYDITGKEELYPGGLVTVVGEVKYYNTTTTKPQTYTH